MEEPDAFAGKETVEILFPVVLTRRTSTSINHIKRWAAR
jgi:hypothetical protein